MWGKRKTKQATASMGPRMERRQTMTNRRTAVIAENTADPSAPDTIVLIHGLWVTSRSWEKWAERYEARGYRVLTPGYPGFEVEVEALNRSEEHTSELQSRQYLVCRLLLEKKTHA